MTKLIIAHCEYIITGG